MTVDEARQVPDNASIVLKDGRMGFVFRWSWTEEKFGIRPVDGGNIIWIPISNVMNTGDFALIEVKKGAIMIEWSELEKIGKLVDKADNYLELFKNDFMSLPMKLDGAKTGLTELRDELKELYLALGGEDVWEDLPSG